RLRLNRELCSRLFAQSVDRLERPLRLIVPEGPTVAGKRPLHLRANLVDRPLRAGPRDRTVGTHLRLMPCRWVVERRPRREQSKLDQSAEGDALLCALALGDLERCGIARFEGIKPRPRGFRVGPLAFNADERTTEPLCRDRGRAGTEKRIEHDIARMAR